jgi:hypothetical protein
MSAGSENLKSHQRQLDMDGVEVGVSRQALDETLSEYQDMLAALKAFISETLGKNPHIKVETTSLAMAAIAKAEGRTP